LWILNFIIIIEFLAQVINKILKKIGQNK